MTFVRWSVLKPHVTKLIRRPVYGPAQFLYFIITHSSRYRYRKSDAEGGSGVPDIGCRVPGAVPVQICVDYFAFFACEATQFTGFQRLSICSEQFSLPYFPWELRKR